MTNLQPLIADMLADRHDAAYIAAVLEAMAPHPLVAAFHAIYDEKDRQRPGSPQAYAAYEAIQKLEAVMVMAEIAVPQRYDARPESVWEAGV